MWLGMLVAIAGQIPLVPVEPLNSPNSLLIAYIAQVAHWMAAPGWALAELRLSVPGLIAAYAGLVCGGWVLREAAARRSSLRASRLRLAPLAAAEAVLVDGGPPGSDLGERLADEGVERLAAVAVTHDQLDHAGGVAELLGSVPVGSLAYSTASRGLLADARAAEAHPVRIARGEAIRSGPLRLQALWPPPTRSGPRVPSSSDPNALSLVLMARWRDFSMLLTGDAEAEAVPLDPGPVDALKVAHHGSEDPGLDRLLERTTPELAVISVGEDNPYGHPAPATTAALDEHDVPALRTDRDGDVVLDVTPRGWTAQPE